MGKNASKNKGSGYERELAKEFSDIFGYHFERAKLSGAFVGGKNAFRKTILSETQLIPNMGDIIPPTEMKKMVVECKFYKEFPFHAFLQNKSIPILDSWIEQQLDIVDDCHFWFIAFKINRAGSYIVIDERLCKDFIDNKLGNHSLYYKDGIKYIVTELYNFVQLYKDSIISKCS